MSQEVQQEQHWKDTAVQKAKSITQLGLARGKALLQRMKPGERQEKSQQKHRQRSWVDRFVDNAFVAVTGLAFLAFLVASLPHVAYFFATFEPQQSDGTVSDWWWFVAYLIAGAINITEFLLSIKFARELHKATDGLPWYQKFIPIVLVTLKFWPFILLISGFSWAANLQHAREFHSDMLLTAESVSVTIPFMPYIKTWGDLNPYIVSAFPILNIAYTLMFDSSRNESDLQNLQPESVKIVSQVTALQPVNVSESTQVTLTDLQNLQQENLQLMKEMQRETVKALADVLQQFVTAKAPVEPTSPVKTMKAPAMKGERKPEVKRSGSKYDEAITKLYQKNRQIKATEAAKLVGCSHVTAGGILKDLRGVKVTEVKVTNSERNTGKLTDVSEGESA